MKLARHPVNSIDRRQARHHRCVRLRRGLVYSALHEKISAQKISGLKKARPDAGAPGRVAAAHPPG
jgi:hypothetical protein